MFSSLVSVPVGPGVVWAVAGSRGLPLASGPLVSSVCSAVVGCGGLLVVGCCRGADALVVSAVGSVLPLSSVSVFAAFASDGFGSCPLSSVGPVRSFAARGGVVLWSAGGGPSVPLRRRLSARSAAVVGAASAGVLLFPGPVLGPGSSLVLSLAASRSLPVFSFGGAVPPGGVPCSFGGVPCSAVLPARGLF